MPFDFVLKSCVISSVDIFRLNDAQRQSPSSIATHSNSQVACNDTTSFQFVEMQNDDAYGQTQHLLLAGTGR